MPTWLESDNGRSYVKDLLRHGGTPLEMQVSAACRTFCRAHDGERNARLTTIRAIYEGPRELEAAREVDQSPQFDRYLDLTDEIGVRLRLRIPIECKHRRDLAVFGFPRPEERTAGLPLVSDFAGAVLVNQLGYHEPAIVRGGSECAIALLALPTRSGKGTAQSKDRIHEENLVHNAGAALYDYVRAVEGQAGVPQVDKTIHEYGLLRALVDFARPHGDWFAAFRPFIRRQPKTLFQTFNSNWIQKTTGGQRYYLEASLHVPVVCTDADLFEVSLDDAGEIIGFNPVHVLLTSLRLAGWPSTIGHSLGRRYPEALVLIADIEGVSQLLSDCLQWYMEMLDLLEATEDIVSLRALVEGLLYRSAWVSTTQHAGRS